MLPRKSGYTVHRATEAQVVIGRAPQWIPQCDFIACVPFPCIREGQAAPRLIIVTEIPGSPSLETRHEFRGRITERVVFHI